MGQAAIAIQCPNTSRLASQFNGNGLLSVEGIFRSKSTLSYFKMECIIARCFIFIRLTRLIDRTKISPSKQRRMQFHDQMHLIPQEKNMSFDNANEMIRKFESVLSETLPDLVQLLQQHQVSSTTEIHLEPEFLDAETTASCTCCWIGGKYRCGRSGGYGQGQKTALGGELQSKLSTAMKGLGGSVDQKGNAFEVHFVVNPAITNSKQSVVCQWDNNSSQGNILQCSNS